MHVKSLIPRNCAADFNDAQFDCIGLVASFIGDAAAPHKISAKAHNNMFAFNLAAFSLKITPFSSQTFGVCLHNEYGCLRYDAASIPLAAAAFRISAPSIRKTGAGFNDTTASPPFPNPDFRMLIFSLHNIPIDLQSRHKNAKQENKYSMYLAVTAACDKDQAAWKDLAAFATNYAKFKTCVANIKTLAEA